jgi:pyruvate formate lyase activating enzyme
MGELGYCGLRKNEKGRLISMVNPDEGLYYAYLDPHVTNCCSAWFCPAGTGSGYPKFPLNKGPEIGCYNLAIFFYGCNFDCLFCQNSSHKDIHSAPSHSIDDLVEFTLNNPKITCWCFFGGSPEPQLPFAIKASERVLEQIPKDRVLRICFEWDGCGHPNLVRRAAELSFNSGGNIKFDLKCFDDSVSLALSGVSNKRAFENFEMIAQDFCASRNDPPVLTATTLMVPGYVDAEEVEGIAKFIAGLDRRIPYSLLVFHPDFLMKDLPVTSLDQALSCYKVARKHLERVNIGNLNLLGYHSLREFVP